MTRRTTTRAEKRRLIIAVAAVAGLSAASVTAARTVGLWVNTTDSMPMGFWIETASGGDLPHSPRSGDVVLLCLPDTPSLRVGQDRGYIAPGPCPTGQEVVLKPVAAAAGDDIIVASAGVSVNGHRISNSAQLASDSRGRPLHPFPAGTYRVPPGDLWLVSGHNAQSFDSRYFGPIPETLVRTNVRPLWVAE
jgi:conjugative transfer signal peptidase TraF